MYEIGTPDSSKKSRVRPHGLANQRHAFTVTEYIDNRDDVIEVRTTGHVLRAPSAAGVTALVYDDDAVISCRADLSRADLG